MGARHGSTSRGEGRDTIYAIFTVPAFMVLTLTVLASTAVLVSTSQAFPVFRRTGLYGTRILCD